MKSANLNFLEPSGLVQACNGTALPLYNVFVVHMTVFMIHTVQSPQLYILLPEDGRVQGPKHVVSLNLCFDSKEPPV